MCAEKPARGTQNQCWWGLEVQSTVKGKRADRIAEPNGPKGLITTYIIS